MSPEWQRRLFVAFNSCVLSTALVECMFANFKQILTRLPRAPSAPLLQSKGLVQTFQRCCKAKHARDQPSTKRRGDTLRRPDWVFRRGEEGCKSGRHLFIGQRVSERAAEETAGSAFARASAEWRGVSEATRATLSRKAAGVNAVSKQIKRSCLESIINNNHTQHCSSPWGISEGSEHPLSEAALQSVLDTKAGVKEGSHDFVSLGTRVMVDPDFPDEVIYDAPIKVFGCTLQVCCSPEAVRPHNRLTCTVRLLHRPPTPLVECVRLRVRSWDLGSPRRFVAPHMLGGPRYQTLRGDHCRI